MLSIDYRKELGGWQKPEIIPYGPIRMDTSASCLHYGISAFEGISVVENPRSGRL
jgi:branched-chain amino acid aminotransferase